LVHAAEVWNVENQVLFDFGLGKAKQISALVHGSAMPENHLVNGFIFTY
jgi:hypothetical protein